MSRIYKYLKLKFLKVVSIVPGTDVEGTITTIDQGADIKGDKIWILVSGAMLASIGLDVNSSAIIIGAMLISPLMNPILGVGLGIGISDRDLLIRAGKNFLLAMVVSLIASTIYFILTPLGEPTTEMFARTKPTLLDVGVAVFGGVAGIVATSRKQQTNAIPGVAIATALMPPLCTAGYGIANWDMKFFFGAFYLFFINAVFISLSTYLIVRILKFPYKQFLDFKVKRKVQTYIATFALIVIIPSGIIFWDVIQEAKLKRDIGSFINENVNNKEYEAINWEINETDSVNTLKLYVIGEPLSDREYKDLMNKMENTSLHDMKLRLVQMNVPKEERDQIKQEVASDVASNIMKQMQLSQNIETMEKKEIDSLNLIIGDLKLKPEIVRSVRKEINIFYPEIEQVQFGILHEIIGDTLEKNVPLAVLDYKGNTRSRTKKELNQKFSDFLKVRLDKDTVYVISN